jgi:hypothetical protein
MPPLRPTLLLSAFATAVLFAAGPAAQNQGVQLTTGVDGGVIYQHSPLFVPPTGITVEAWITYDDATVPTGAFYWPTIARQNVTPNQESWNFRVSAGNASARSLQFIVRTTTNQLFSATYNFAPAEFAAFAHVAGTFDGQTIRIHKNGVLVASAPIAGTSEIPNNGGELRIGNGDPIAPGNEAWNGVIDEVRIWPMARAANEILADMQDELSGMPGGVLSFPFNGGFDESGLAITGAPFGAVAFAPGAPGLAPRSVLTFATAPPTSTCARSAELALGSAPLVGNGAFVLWAVRGPRPSASPLGIIVAATAAPPASQPPILGVNLGFDVASVAAQTVLIPPTNALGNARFALPIPNVSGLSGVALVFQFGFADSACGPQGFSASDGRIVAFQ